MLAVQMNSSAPKQALTGIQSLEDTIMKRHPNAEARKEFSELIEVLNILEKHEGPKQASLNHLIATDYSVGFMHTNPFAA